MCWFFKYEILFYAIGNRKNAVNIREAMKLDKVFFYTFVSLEVTTIYSTCSKLYIKKDD